MASYKTKRTLKQILAVALAGLAAFGAIFGLVKLSEKLKEETKVVHPSFSVGGLNENGEYEETDGSIYTKDSFECKGLSVKLDFDSNVSWQAFYYDSLDKYLLSSAVYDESMELNVPETAVYARLEVTPIWAEDVEEEDRVVHWYNVAKYANQLEIQVSKDQSVEEVELEAISPTVVDDFEALGGFGSHTDVVFSAGTFAYRNLALYENKTIQKIGVPVTTLSDNTVETYMTIYVLEADTSTSTPTFVSVAEHKLKIPAHTYSTTTVNEWVYFDCNIEVGNNQTLSFSNADDTIAWGYMKGTTYSDYLFYQDCTESGVKTSNNMIFFDVYAVKE